MSLFDLISKPINSPKGDVNKAFNALVKKTPTSYSFSPQAPVIPQFSFKTSQSTKPFAPAKPNIIKTAADLVKPSTLKQFPVALNETTKRFVAGRGYKEMFSPTTPAPATYKEALKENIKTQTAVPNAAKLVTRDANGKITVNKEEVNKAIYFAGSFGGDLEGGGNKIPKGKIINAEIAAEQPASKFISKPIRDVVGTPLESVKTPPLIPKLSKPINEVISAPKPQIEPIKPSIDLTQEARKYKSAEEFSAALKKRYGDDVRFAKVSDIQQIEPKLNEGTLEKYRQEYKKDPLSFMVKVSEGNTKKLNAVDGNHRLAVLRENGVEYVPVRIDSNSDGALGNTLSPDAYAINNFSDIYNQATTQVESTRVPTQDAKRDLTFAEKYPELDTEKDRNIIMDVQNEGEYTIPRTSNKDIDQINEMGIHPITPDTPVVYDIGALTHYTDTRKLPQKTKHLTPAESEAVISNPDEILPNSIRGNENAYLYVKQNPETLSIVEVLDDGNKLRVVHGGFEVKDPKYLAKERALKNSILERRHSLISQPEPDQGSMVSPKGTAVVSLSTSQDRIPKLSETTVPDNQTTVNKGSYKPADIKKHIQANIEAISEKMSQIATETRGQQSGLQAETMDTQLQGLQDSATVSLEEFDRMNKDDFSYNKIILQPDLHVKNKVNLLDYYRTPDRVLEKIGLSKLSGDIRAAYESYLSELPVHIDIISDWAKRAPSPEANKRIFRYLDGQEHRDFHAGKEFTALQGEELKVAKEIKAYLEDWSQRLGLPDDNKISHYITHIFALGDVEKEFPEEVANIIKDRVPGSVYDPFLEKRLGRKGYIEDTWRALDAYVKRAVRKANMDPVLERLHDAVTRPDGSSRVDQSIYDYVKKYGDLINMRPTNIDSLLDNFIKSSPIGYKLGQRPTAYVSRLLRQWTYRSMLGLNIGSAIRNLTQGVNTYAKLGEKWTAYGYMKLLTSAYSQELEDVGILKQDFVQDRSISSTKKALQKVDKGLFAAFETAERINRGAAYFGAKAKAIAEGSSEEQAIEYAKKIVRDTQFQFGSIDTPVGLNSDLMKIATQFMSFGVKQTEFAAEVLKNKDWPGILRYIAAAMLITYTVGQAFNIKGTDFIPGYGFTKFGTPPALNLPIQIIKALVNAPDDFGNQQNLGDKIGNVAAAVPIPGSVQLQKTYRGLGGQSLSDTISPPKRTTEKTPFQDLSTLNKARAVIFGKPLEPKTTTESTVLDEVLLYGHALGVDPLTAFNRIFTGQKIKRVDNGAIIVERLPLADSEAYKKELGANTSAMKLDHKSPLELGGSNAKINLKIVPTATWASYSPVENYIGGLLRTDKIDKKQAQELITQFKDGQISTGELTAQYGGTIKQPTVSNHPTKLPALPKLPSLTSPKSKITLPKLPVKK